MLIPILIVVAIGLVCAGILTIASKVFFVPVDETFARLRAELPGANCGACGYAGCDDYANALAEDKSVSCTKCPVGGAAVADKLAEVLGVEAGAEEKKVAVVMCNGTTDAAKKLMDYDGLKTCAAAKQFFGGVNQCPYGCIALGDCVRACEYDAIEVVNGVAMVNRDNCVACGMCAKACPNSIIRISTAKNKVMVQCKSKAKGADTRKACSNGCIGCKQCEKVCKFDSVHVEDNLAYIDPDKCKNCGMCAKVCPTGAINNLRLQKGLSAEIQPGPKLEIPKMTPPKKEAPKAAPKAEETKPAAEAPKAEETKA